MDTKNVIATIQDGIGRVYNDETWRYPSVTTVLQVVGDKEWLLDWREKVGDEFADAHTKIATDIGTAMHDDYEKYLSGETLKQTITPEEIKARQMFKASIKKFEKLYKRAVIQEVLVVSHEYKVAGRFDAIAECYNNELHLVDFKNTRRPKTRKDIEAYKFQLAFYHRMLKETMPQYKIKKHVVFMVNREGIPTVFRFDIDEVTDIELRKIRGRFYKEFGL